MIVVYMPPQRIAKQLREVIGFMERDFHSWTSEKQMHGPAFLAWVSIGLRSCLTRWNVAPPWISACSMSWRNSVLLWLSVLAGQRRTPKQRCYKSGEGKRPCVFALRA